MAAAAEPQRSELVIRADMAKTIAAGVAKSVAGRDFTAEAKRMDDLGHELKSAKGGKR